MDLKTTANEIELEISGLEKLPAFTTDQVQRIKMMMMHGLANDSVYGRRVQALFSKAHNK
jgi:hypothetical protein